jgi:flagellar biosynthesis protein FlhF
MLIKTFRAKSIQEALQLVRDKLGPDACVLSTREVRSDLIGRRLVEVEASQPYRVNNAAPPGFAEATSPGANNSAAVVKSLPRTDEEPSIAIQVLQAQLSSDSQLSHAPAAPPINAEFPLLTHPEFPPGSLQDPNNQPADSRATSSHDSSLDDSESQAILRELARAGIEIGFARQLLRTAQKRCAPQCRHDVWLIRGQLIEMIAEKIKSAPEIPYLSNEQRIVAAVGPSGVGKTTLLGKIATRAYREAEMQIGFVTLDTWRSGAVERLLELAELVSAEVEVISSLDQIIPALQRLRELDLVMIDTAGRSPQDGAGLDDLRELLQIAQPDETHLVMPASASANYIKSTSEKFSPVGLTHLSISKMDECSDIGQWLVPLCLGRLPVHYLSSGNQMEADLIVPNARRLAGLILGQSAQVPSQA